ncbi:Metal transporter Nramp5 [Hibiscus syriacus]|uniref:Metal transporter Nramp5 n=1 Tax=Hibiscus syriacus TaxID=106335 RepID=A0A6A3AJW5_HIBSY|nr:Metal transporter Nramp5 [Hibiscus syriacus]
MNYPTREEESLKEEPDKDQDTTEESESKRLLASQPPSSPSFDDENEVTFESREKIVIVDLETPESIGNVDYVPPFSWKKLWMFTGPGFFYEYSVFRSEEFGRHLAELCREEYPTWARFVLWFVAELALIEADIQEVIGSAIAIQILSKGALPLWAGVLITASDCFIFLFMENYGVRKLEAVFAVLIATMALSFAWMFGDTKPSGKELLIGILVPRIGSKTIRQAVGVVGCFIMPHNVFLHSALVQSRKIDPKKRGRVQEALNYYSIESSIALMVSFMINLFVTTIFAKGFYGTKQANSIGLVNAGQYLEEKYGGGLFPILYIWGIGLLAAGQSSTITGTYAGQFIMGGFLNLRLKKWLRALITRSFAIVPKIIVAIVFNTSEASLDTLNEWLNVLQSIQIPFALIPLLTLVSKELVMGVFRVGLILERLAWTVAALVIVINGYLLFDFFVSKVKGLLFGLLISIWTAAYLAFIVYLVIRGNALPPTGFRIELSKRCSVTGS